MGAAEMNLVEYVDPRFATQIELDMGPKQKRDWGINN